MSKRNLFLVEISLFLIILLSFCYFRLKPLYYQTVPYTFDQGRDFLKAREIIHDHNLTLIGPTSGINGLFHGAWWYYFLTIPYILFSANPVGFYYFIFFLALVQTILFYLFLRRQFGSLAALYFIAVISFSPYFILLSIFAISTALVPPLLLVLFYSFFSYLKTQKNFYLFALFLSLGLIFEAELAFGLFIIPAFLITFILTKQFQVFLKRRKKILIAFSGLVLASLPRIIFELKNNFLQTRAFLNFFQNPSSTNQTAFKTVFFDRIHLLSDYYFSLFSPDAKFLAIIIFIITVFILIIGIRRLDSIKRQFTRFILILFLALFAMSLFYRNNFFWSNYLEGVSYFYVLLISIAIYYISTKEKKINILLYIGLFIFILVSLNGYIKEMKNSATLKKEGLVKHNLIVDELYKEAGGKDLCLRIYTPPVIPYTYDYIFSWREKIGQKKPTTNYVNHQCWYLIENEPYKFRVDKFRSENIPTGAKLIKKRIIADDVMIELWQEK